MNKLLLCRLGIHKWIQNRDLHIIDIFPPPFLNYKNPERTCNKCKKTQFWLPGYGGSEIGCWSNR